jgi:hypothetical protein
MRLPKTPASQNVVVKRLIEGHYDENYNWVEPGEQAIATIINASILPKSGRERAATVQTTYESEWTLWAGTDNITFEEGFSELERGDVVVVGAGEKAKRYRIVFPGFYGAAYEVALKEELG